MSTDEAGWVELLESAVSRASQGMLLADATGVLIMANRSAQHLLGDELGRAVGAPFAQSQTDIIKWRFTNPDDYEGRILRSVRDGVAAAWRQETVDERLLEVECTPLRDAAGRISGHIQTLNDVTDARRELETAIQESKARRAELEARERRIAEQAALTNAAYQIAAALTPEEIHRRLMAEAARLAGVDRLAILRPRTDDVTDVAIARGFEGSDAERLAVHAGDAVRRAIDSRRTVLCNDSGIENSPAAHAAAGAGLRALMLVPITLAERAYGVLAVCADEPRAFGEREVRLFNELAGHAANALTNAQQFARNRELADSFQHSVVAKGLPDVAGLELAALYRAAADELVGGDFYDVWEISDGRVAVVVGDVSGKGPRAAATTAMVRHMIEGLSTQGNGPSEIIDELNRLLYPRLADDALVTMVMAVYDPGSASLTWCNAGHPPPLLMTEAGGIELLSHPGPPCGCLIDAEYRSFTSAFGPGDTLLLYTDGLTEARRDGEEFGHDRLVREAVKLNRSTPATLSRGLYASVRGWSRGQVDDDVAIAVVRQVGA
ncbi:MAG: SpoIIE family protein phosphatase [Thermoleophilia bacterium]|nr:SpoIIE family protein phosphatase [Thermoleophilia bacterium]MDH3725046.1 SpoIIE family protein phosphatase [Thermoleophilia bacterium]